MLFPGFEQKRIAGEGAEINLRIGGKGPSLLLLHGYPQTHAMWHRIAPRLAEDFTVICADLRGYGDSSKPATLPDHASYAKRATAADMVAVMQALGFARFCLAGHDRGGRVAHRLALDHPQAVEKLAVLDIIPTRTLFETVNQQVATGYYHWFFLAQPYDMPERLIGADPEYYLRRKTGQWSGAGFQFDPQAWAEYVRCFSRPETIHASCEDYRAAAGIDLEHDRADDAKRIECPLLVLWGEKGLMHKAYDVLATWKDKTRAALQGHAVPSGHFLPEEAPEETYQALRRFFIS
ncbi:MAG TPA: alpha/beta hydrolase [Ferrovibrio sp.]|jgi:haloacetate dehalogenase|uniref:alpha/beta fold hydrolase n=1 Tax=Ferrovibrio sp. TaxID=1917215 RepID=UPI002ED2C729